VQQKKAQEKQCYKIS